MKTKIKQNIKKIIAGCMAFVCACSAVIVGYATNWFGAVSRDGVNHNQQLSFGSFFGNGLSIVAASAETLAATDGATTLTALVTPEEFAPYVSVDWGVSWQNADSEWATGKAVTDYVTITPTEDGALTAEVKCKEAFGEKVVIKVALRDNDMLSASCVCDYRTRYDEITMSLFGREFTIPKASGGNTEYGRFDLELGDFASNKQQLEFIEGRGVGTVNDKNREFTYSYDLNPLFRSNLKEKNLSVSSDIFYSNNTAEIDSSGLSHTLWLPGFNLIDATQRANITKGLRFANEMNMETDELTQECVNDYNAYREAMQKLSGDKYGYLATVTISVKDLAINKTYSYSLKIYMPKDYMPNVVDEVALEQSSILF